LNNHSYSPGLVFPLKDLDKKLFADLSDTFAFRLIGLYAEEMFTDEYREQDDVEHNLAVRSDAGDFATALLTLRDMVLFWRQTEEYRKDPITPSASFIQSINDLHILEGLWEKPVQPPQDFESILSKSGLDETEAKICRLYRQDISVENIGKKVGLKSTAVRKRLAHARKIPDLAPFIPCKAPGRKHK